MSLFASLGQGDIWALSGISFASPVNDILDRGNYTIEELLNEDDIIQEVKNKNDRLIEFLSSDECMGTLLEYIVKCPNDEESAEKMFRFPYMSCEVLCCEVPELLKKLVEDSDGRYIQKLISFLDQSNELNCHQAGYFEKILEMLFRRMTVEMMNYFNSCGMKLLEVFLKHIYNYSIMQIVQRLMLPHIPFTAASESDIINEEENKNCCCNWSYTPEACKMLLDTMFDATHFDVPLHISDLLITVLQLSPPETLLIKYLCEEDVIQRLLSHATKRSTLVQGSDDQSHVDYNISLAATAVLESLISRLLEAEYSLHETNDNNYKPDPETVQVIQQRIKSVCDSVFCFIPEVKLALDPAINVGNEEEKAQTQSSRRLGHHILQLVKLVEAVVRIGNESLDEVLCSSGVFVSCLKLFFLYENNSLLHLSVQRIFVAILEGSEKRSVTEAYICKDCQLLRVIMAKIGDDSKDNVPLVQEILSIPNFNQSRHSSIIGNLMLIAQNACFALENPDQNADSRTGKGLFGDDSQADFGSSPLHDTSRGALRNKLKDDELLSEWDEFVNTKLKVILDHQMMASYEASQNSGLSPQIGEAFASFPVQDDPRKLAVDLELFDENKTGVTNDGIDNLIGYFQSMSTHYGEENVDHDIISGFADFATFESSSSEDSHHSPPLMSGVDDQFLELGAEVDFGDDFQGDTDFTVDEKYQE